MFSTTSSSERCHLSLHVGEEGFSYGRGVSGRQNIDCKVNIRSKSARKITGVVGGSGAQQYNSCDHLIWFIGHITRAMRFTLDLGRAEVAVTKI